MALPFHQSIRALQAEREWAPVLIAASALVLLALWLGWFLWAPVSLYETGVLVGVTRGGTVVANFPTQVVDRLRPGQFALLRVQDDRGSALLPASASAQQVISAVVILVDASLGADVSEVTLSSLSAEWPSATLSSGYPLSGTVAVDVGQVSPAQLLWRASRPATDAGTVSFSSTSP